MSGSFKQLLESFEKEINNINELTEEELQMMIESSNWDFFMSPVTQDKIKRFFNKKGHQAKVKYALELMQKMKADPARKNGKNPMVAAAEIVGLDPRAFHQYINKGTTEGVSMNEGVNFSDKDIRKVMTMPLEKAKQFTLDIIDKSIKNPRKKDYLSRQAEKQRDVTGLVHQLYNMLLAGEGLGVQGSGYSKKYNESSTIAVKEEQSNKLFQDKIHDILIEIPAVEAVPDEMFWEIVDEILSQINVDDVFGYDYSTDYGVEVHIEDEKKLHRVIGSVLSRHDIEH